MVREGLTIFLLPRGGNCPGAGTAPGRSHASCLPPCDRPSRIQELVAPQRVQPPPSLETRRPKACPVSRGWSPVVIANPTGPKAHAFKRTPLCRFFSSALLFACFVSWSFDKSSRVLAFPPVAYVLCSHSVLTSLSANSRFVASGQYGEV